MKPYVTIVIASFYNLYIGRCTSIICVILSIHVYIDEAIFLS